MLVRVMRQTYGAYRWHSGERYFSLLACFPFKIVFTQFAEPEKIKYLQGMERNKKSVIVLSENSGANPLY